jgi:hypothetical protein
MGSDLGLEAGGFLLLGFRDLRETRVSHIVYMIILRSIS